MKCSDSYTRYP